VPYQKNLLVSDACLSHQAACDESPGAFRVQSERLRDVELIQPMHLRVESSVSVRVLNIFICFVICRYKGAFRVQSEQQCNVEVVQPMHLS
jgi:hypothetical protein